MLKNLDDASSCAVVFFLSIMIFVAFFAGMFSSSKSFDYRYPTENNWFVDHQGQHYPGVLVSPALKNTSCHQQGNVAPPTGENITQILWLGGYDAGFVGNFKIVYDDTMVIVPAPSVGKCVYVMNATGNITVYGQDITSGGWIKLGSGNSSSDK